MKDKFTDSERRIATAMADEWSRTAWAPSAKLAEMAACNKATVSRFIRRLGYADHEALKLAARAAASQKSELGDPDLEGVGENRASWLLHEIASLERDAKGHIVSLRAQDLEYHADQVHFVAERLSRAKRIVIVAASEDDKCWLPPVYDLFSSSLTTPVILDRPSKRREPRQGDHQVILHVANNAASSSPAPYDWALAEKNGTYAVHLVAGSAAPKLLDAHRVLHVHDGIDRLAGLAMLIDTCIVIIRDITQRDSSKARVASINGQTERLLRS